MSVTRRWRVNETEWQLLRHANGNRRPTADGRDFSAKRPLIQRSHPKAVVGPEALVFRPHRRLCGVTRRLGTDWKEAEMRVNQAVKGVTAGETVIVRISGSLDVGRRGYL